MQNNQLKATSPLAEWLSYLENSHFKAIDLGLERVKTVAQELDLLRPAPLVITVGGTNGKGTTCRLLETLLLNAGLRVGVYSSPHLIRYNERVRIQNQELADSEHTASFAFIEQHKSQSLTYFEYSTLSALHLFKRAKLDVGILEVGLGGRLDATNIVDADIAVITGIDIDHVDFLGSDRNRIAFEKAGIFRAGKPAVIGEPNIPPAMLQHAEQLHCVISCCNQDWQFSKSGEYWQWQNKRVRLENLPLCRIPLANAATALAVLPYLPFDISSEIIHQSLQQVELTGRFQQLRGEQLVKLGNPAQLPQMIIDVGHNPHAARYLAEKLTALKPSIKGKIITVCGILKDKDANGVLSPLLPIIDHWHCVTLNGYRGQSGLELLKTLQGLAQSTVSAQAEDSVQAGVQSAVQNADKNDLILVFGSFHTVGEFLQML
ncbi:dihydrofolate synthase/folylpolyglutamate synthase [Cricetibacter osteomyelitidis]|uniref:Dihydrofolate synthase/folylpolyglutamate synthase n=1 Tax=Cricetibacter osteomyelitidis TaxID=1521931 RepID=A0A4R2SWG4_9PAST|nr:bifunctional tetrahydrofolate synthase/dihydrofolate synthase [Cricetibacter osteomyelitidis]TCP94817.1 dihydrofolate synthase/folylpolyglutamate synthase [Cricetibacter osteomyelitidis]